MVKFDQYIIALAFLILSSCAPQSDKEEDEKEPTKTLWRAKELPFTLSVSPESKKLISAHWNAAFGRLEMEIPPSREVFVLQADYGVEDKIADLNLDVFQIHYLVKTDSLLIYESTIPSGNVSYWHFFRSFSIDGKDYYAENNPLVECTKNDVMLMSEIFRKIRPVEENFAKTQ